MQILKEMDTQINSLSSRTESGSVLGNLEYPSGKLAGAAYEELRKRVPFLFGILNTVVYSPTKSDTSFEQVVSLVYAILMRTRNQRLTAYQHVMTAVCLRYHASNQVS